MRNMIVQYGVSNEWFTSIQNLTNESRKPQQIYLYAWLTYKITHSMCKIFKETL